MSARRNAPVVKTNVTRNPMHDAHVVAWRWSEERAASLGYVAVINGRVVNDHPVRRDA